MAKTPKVELNIPLAEIKRTLKFLEVVLADTNPATSSYSIEEYKELRASAKAIFKAMRALPLLPLGGPWKLDWIQQLSTGDRFTLDTKKVKHPIDYVVYSRVQKVHQPKKTKGASE